MGKIVKTFLKDLESRGWVIVREGRHYVLRHASGHGQITVPKSPSDWRGLKNTDRLAARLEQEARELGLWE